MGFGEALRDFGAAIRLCLTKFFTFSGRAPRAEFWWFALFSLLATSLAEGADRLLGTATATGGIVGALISLGLMPPSLAVLWRRLHDIGRPGWHVLGVLAGVLAVSATALLFIGGENPPPLPPIVLYYLMIAANVGGALVVLVWLVWPSEPRPNRFGPQAG